MQYGIKNRKGELTLFKSIEDIMKIASGAVEVFEVEAKSIGYHRRKTVYEKCEAPPEPAPYALKKSSRHDEDDDLEDV